MPNEKRNPDTIYGAPSFGYPVTPSDSAELGPSGVLPRGIYVGTGGDLVGELADSPTLLTFKNVPDGAELIYQFRRIKATGTTATDILAFA